MPNKILIVDDDPDAVLFLSTVLKYHGYETIEAPDGQKGLETAKSENPDLILLDLMMPHKRIVFLIGGAQGFSEKVYKRANAKLSLSRMTFSHQMIRLFFLEQLYRAMTILRNEPYHNQG